MGSGVDTESETSKTSDIAYIGAKSDEPEPVRPLSIHSSGVDYEME